MSTIGQYSVFIGNSGWTYGFSSLNAARTFVAKHEGKRYDIHKGAKLVESGKVHPATPGTGGRVWLVKNPSHRRSKNPTGIYPYSVHTAMGREYFRDMQAANRAAQVEADRMGKPVARRDLSGGQSLFYPKRNPNPALYSVYSDDGLVKEGFKTLADARAFAKRMAIDQNTYVYRNEDRLTTYKMKFPKSRNPFPVGRYVTVKARRLPNGKIELRGAR